MCERQEARKKGAAEEADLARNSRGLAREAETEAGSELRIRQGLE